MTASWYNGHVILIQATFVSLLFVLSLQIPLRFGVFSFAGAGAYAMGGYLTAITVSEELDRQVQHVPKKLARSADRQFGLDSHQVLLLERHQDSAHNHG